MSWAAVSFSKMLFKVHRGFEKGYQNQHFQSIVLVGNEGGGHKKCTLCMFLIILDDPLVHCTHMIMIHDSAVYST